MALAAYKNEAVAKGLGPQGICPRRRPWPCSSAWSRAGRTASPSSTKAGFPDRAALEQAEIEVLKGYPSCHAGGPGLEAAVRDAIQAVAPRSRRTWAPS